MANCKPITLSHTGITYPSMRAAAKALRVGPSALRYALKYDMDLSKVGKYYNQPVEVNGVTYSSAKEAAFQLDMKVSGIYSIIQRARNKRKQD